MKTTILLITLLCSTALGQKVEINLEGNVPKKIISIEYIQAIVYFDDVPVSSDHFVDFKLYRLSVDKPNPRKMETTTEHQKTKDGFDRDLYAVGANPTQPDHVAIGTIYSLEDGGDEVMTTRIRYKTDDPGNVTGIEYCEVEHLDGAVQLLQDPVNELAAAGELVSNAVTGSPSATVPTTPPADTPPKVDGDASKGKKPGDKTDDPKVDNTKK